MMDSLKRKGEESPVLSKKYKLDSKCISPIKNDKSLGDACGYGKSLGDACGYGKPCNCGDDDHADEYNKFCAFVRDYNKICVIDIKVSEETYENKLKYIFIKYATERRLVDNAYRDWLRMNDYLPVPASDYIYKQIAVYVVHGEKRIFELKVHFVTSDIKNQHKFVDYCNKIQYFDEWYNRWYTYDMDKSLLEYNKNKPCSSPVLYDGKPCYCGLNSHQIRYDMFWNYANKKNIDMSVDSYEEWWLRVYNN
jgi:hypothetical protein